MSALAIHEAMLRLRASKTKSCDRLAGSRMIRDRIIANRLLRRGYSTPGFSVKV